jgi:organic radical activating enzyme
LVTSELWQPNLDNPRTEKINVERLAQAALDQGRLPSTIWKSGGEPLMMPHPLQTPL